MKTVEETRRELFKALAETRGLNLWYRFKGGEYADEITSSAWWAFNAALDAIVIKLPISDFPDGCGDVYEAINIDQMITTINSLNLGIKVK